MPERIRLQRTRGWRKPAGARVVSRPGPFGNPFRAGDPAPDGSAVTDRADAVRRFREWFTAPPSAPLPFADRHATMHARLEELRGRDLACWCPLDGPCHADVLLEFANRPEHDLSAR